MIIAAIAGLVALDPLEVTSDTATCQTTGTLSCDNTKTQMSDSALSVQVENPGTEAVIVSNPGTETVNDQSDNTSCTTDASLLKPNDQMTITCKSLDLVEGEQNSATIEYDEYKADQGPRYTRKLEVSVEAEPNPEVNIAFGGSKTAPSSLSNTLSSMQGSGTPADPYEITNVSELQAVNADTSASYEMVNDIAASNTELWNSGAGFDPISGFSGDFDGLQNSINGLTVNRSSTTGTGVFGSIGSSAYVHDIQVNDAKIIGNTDAGALTGANDGTIRRAAAENVYVEGAGSHVGMLVGTHDGGIIDLSKAEGTVFLRNGNELGGLIGSNHDPAQINDSYAVGNVESAGTPSGTGGLVGGASGSLDVYNSYAAAYVESSNGRGFNGDGLNNWADNYWDEQKSNKTTGTNAIGLTTSDMQGGTASSTMSGLDFGSTWQTTSGYPELAWE
jgi:hypothetical protein